MKNIIILKLILLFLLISSCTKNEEIIIEKPTEKVTFYESTGTITGPDFSYEMCVCCSGYKLIIDNVVLPTNILADNFRFYNFPANSNIDLTTATFPLKVKLNWSQNPAACGQSSYQIIIDDIALN